MSESKTCFVIAPIGEEGSETRKRTDQIFRHIINPIATPQGYKAEMAHHVAEPGSITTQIIARILNADLVIADLTGHNANVLYELAVRHVVRKPVVQIIQKGEKLPFDISQQRTISIDLTDPDSMEEAKKALTGQIESVQKDPTQVDSPISMAVNLPSLRSSEKPIEAALAEMMSLLQEIREEQKSQSYRTVSFGVVDALAASRDAIEKDNLAIKNAFLRYVNMPTFKGELLAEAVRERMEKNKRKNSSPDTQEKDEEE